ncbi:unnamed protein product [Clonostachys chloroleuca]|uniref:Uncharacterized protein n=1 Tax=Clonostachys chloroleuca TaxID=1926264 RepID=A0AA35LX98_9HYPO|nr:unnamed protein product [Clonostachys chloroleuca]
MTPPKGEEDPLPCPSWIVSNGTNIQYAPPQVLLHNTVALQLTGSFSLAEDRSWFADDYMPVESFVEISFGGTLPVIGMCTVNLPIKVAANKTGPTSHGTMRLENVLNVPSILCNIIGAPVYDEYAYSVRSRAFTDPATGRQVAYCKPDTKLCEIQLSGPPIGTEVGPSSIDPSPSVIHVIGAFWPESKQTRIATEIKRKDDMKSTSSGFFGDNEDSELARSVLRNFMLGKRPTLEDDDENNEGEDEGDSSTDGDESVPDEQYVDHLFTESNCVQWLESKYGSTQNFLLIQKLKPAFGSDCDDARIRAKALMAEAGIADDDSDTFWV